MAGSGKANLVAGVAGIEHLVSGLEHSDLGANGDDDPATALSSLVDRDDQAARRLGLVERLKRHFGSLSHRVEHRNTLPAYMRPAATIRARNCCVRGSRGFEKIWS